MSPVSRGRKPKKGKKPPARSTNSGWAKPAKRVSGDPSPGFRSPPKEFPESLIDRPQWWKPSLERLIAASSGLLAAQGPRALEQATADLVGGELYRALREERSGLPRFDVWAIELVYGAVNRMLEAASQGGDAWRGPWWLLHGLAAVGSFGLEGLAREKISRAADSLPSDILDAEPTWLKLLPDIMVTGDLLVMRDLSGTRFGVIANFCYPGDVDPSVYLLDIDACGFATLAGAGVFDDPDQGAAAWRSRVGDSAGELAPGPLTAEAVACLVWSERQVPFFQTDASPDQMDNWFRGPRRIHEILTALRERGVVLPEFDPLHRDIDHRPMADSFARWCAERHRREPGREAVEGLAWEWLQGMQRGTEYAVSPHRSEIFLEYIRDWGDDAVTDEALALIPEWVRWIGEQAGIPVPLTDQAVHAAAANPR